jgi:UDP-N-acetylmuramate dehydrogenase
MGNAGPGDLVLKININGISSKGNLIVAGAGATMAKLTAFAAKNSLAGLDWAGGLPGTLGGAIRGNAGCFGGEIKDNIKNVRSFNVKTMRPVTRSAAQCRFGYRTSFFKRHPGEIILEATFRMKKGAQKKIFAALHKEKSWRKAHHPLEYPSAGSVFKNVPLSHIFKPRSKSYRDAVKNLAVRYRGSSFSVKTDPIPVIAAAKLIGESGLAGTRRGGAMISPKHTNFIVNTGNATVGDVLFLINLAQEKVYRKFGIRLEPEIQIVGK